MFRRNITLHFLHCSQVQPPPICRIHTKQICHRTASPTHTHTRSHHRTRVANFQNTQFEFITRLGYLSTLVGTPSTNDAETHLPRDEPARDRTKPETTGPMHNVCFKPAPVDRPHPVQRKTKSDALESYLQLSARCTPIGKLLPIRPDRPSFSPCRSNTVGDLCRSAR